jgi:hypothetical protein
MDTGKVYGKFIEFRSRICKKFSQSHSLLIQNSKREYLDIYRIEGTINLDRNDCYAHIETYPNFQSDLENFKVLLSNLVTNGLSKTLYKFGDGDFFFLRGKQVGSAQPGKRAISRELKKNELREFRKGSVKSDFYMCELYPENRKKFKRALPRKQIDFPAEFVYGLVANRWIFQEFAGHIGLIGADAKIELIKELMQKKSYQDYLGLEKFSDYISVPQKFACDDLSSRLSELEVQLQMATSKIFLVGVGHLKSGILHKLPEMHEGVYLDVGSGIDAIAGIIDQKRPFFGGWVNYRLSEQFNYEKIDFLQYEESQIVYLD